MAHELARANDMVYTGTAPWHQLGESFPDGISLEELKQHPCLAWRVALQALMLADGRTAPAFAVVRQDTQAILGVVGPRYTPIQNSTNLDWFSPYLETGQVSIETAGTIGGGRRVWILAKILCSTQDLVGHDDPVDAYFLASNSHDGTSAQRLGFTAIRVVCANTMRAAHGQGSFVQIRHTAGAAKAMEEVRQVIDLARRQFSLDLDDLRWLSHHKVRAGDIPALIAAAFARNQAERAKLLEAAIQGAAPADQPALVENTSGVDFAALLERPRNGGAMPAPKVAKDETFEGRLTTSIVPLIEHGRGNDRPGYAGTALGVYSGIAEYITHERGRTSDSRLEAQWFGAGADILESAREVLTGYCKYAAAA